MIAPVPTHDYRRTGYRTPPRPLRGLDSVVDRGAGWWQRRAAIVAGLHRDAAAIDALAGQWIEVSDGILSERLLGFREEFRRGRRQGEAVLFPALAAIREAADRQLGLRPFPVQLMGALALHRGYLAEMATGEGKTLTAGLAAVLAGWTRLPCHVVTVNDYLVERDAAWLGQLYQFCGVRVGCVTGAMEPAARQQGYAADVTYTTSKELLADFLRDRLRLGILADPARRLVRRLLAPRTVGEDGLVMRGLHTAIVDEADSVLIDEAVTPLIISATRENALLKEAGLAASQLASDLVAGEDYRTNFHYHEIELTAAGVRKLEERTASLPGLWRGRDRSRELVTQALNAREFFHRDKQYIVVDGKVVIVDEFTGRPMPQRTWREGLHQAIEAREGVKISDPSETMARLSFQRFFRCFHRLAGMSGTAREAAAEIWQIYRLPVISIPTNKPCIRQLLADKIFKTDEEKWAAIATEIQRIHATGRPLLVGTRSVLASEKLAAMLATRGLACDVINATRLDAEASIISLAGEASRITIAANMAGRGTDIKLGRGVAALGGLHVIATERHESGRVDRQLFGRSGRQGDPGSAQAFVSIEDELVRRHLPLAVQGVLRWALQSAAPGKGPFARGAFSLAQRNAQVRAYQQRQGVLRSDTWLGEALSFAGVELA